MSCDVGLEDSKSLQKTLIAKCVAYLARVLKREGGGELLGLEQIVLSDVEIFLSTVVISTGHGAVESDRLIGALVTCGVSIV